MLGLLVILLISWGLLFLVEKKNLGAIGIAPTPKHLAQFLAGFAIIVIFCSILVYIETVLKAVQWESKGFHTKVLFKAFIYHIKSALTEDLVFRGALLYVLIKRLGHRWAIFLSALCFGVYHVFSYGITTERWVLIGYVILITGVTGYVWAYAFYKTKSIYIGLGLHLGYNLLMSCFYESQPYGELLFGELAKTDLSEPYETYYAFFRGLFPSVMTLLVLILLNRSRLILSKNKSEQE
ncbi:CPBP family intramembrane metalloprotease [Aureisphaera galaxeae]|uniref:CPBP family intramembrane glutamic endopeptidase n=1 Tax=Aureisphaera galaxeae TaxID=1538023 RepID=UPI0023505805|nr:CPBP family intramembrane glutamic endopeptidase [Aureisphaera galaxeae]MDC8002506.1 CPBP family intramembrane metalloprotease [Aureisphaera galaxeae]